MWEILLLDFFAVGDCGTGLFCCGRFYCWTFLLWEILMLDFLASGQLNCTAKKLCDKRPTTLACNVLYNKAETKLKISVLSIKTISK